MRGKIKKYIAFLIVFAMIVSSNVFAMDGLLDDGNTGMPAKEEVLEGTEKEVFQLNAILAESTGKLNIQFKNLIDYLKNNNYNNYKITLTHDDSKASITILDDSKETDWKNAPYGSYTFAIFINGDEYAIDGTYKQEGKLLNIINGKFTTDSTDNTAATIQFDKILLRKLIDIIATKEWDGGSTPRPTVWFKLYRQVGSGTSEAVPEVDIKTLPDGTTQVKWSDLVEKDKNGKVYTFSVKEVNANGNDFTPSNYNKSEVGLTVTNSFITNDVTYSVTFQAGANGSLTGTTSFTNILSGTDWDEVIEVPTPVPNSGYRFTGWTPTFPETVTESATYTANFARRSTPDRDRDRDRDEEEIIEEVVPEAVPELNMNDHFQYIQGYPDNTVRPEGLITREEVAAVFYRLLAPGYRQSIWTQSENFQDVTESRWSLKHIATLANGGVIEGYPDGNFRPGNFITRAELATMASRFDNLSPATSNSFSDIAGHWANPYINSAATKGWVNGYPDGSFRPNQYITRAEFVTLVNNVLNRRVHADDILPEARTFHDLPASAWYYETMQEAINSHNYERLADTYEEWTEIYYPMLDM